MKIMNGSFTLGSRKSDEQFFGAWNPNFDFFETSESQTDKVQEPTASGIANDGTSNIFLDLLKSPQSVSVANDEEISLSQKLKQCKIDAKPVEDPNREFSLADLYFSNVKKLPEDNQIISSQTEINSGLFGNNNKERNELSKESEFDFSFLTSDNNQNGSDKENDRHSLSSIFLKSTLYASLNISKPFSNEKELNEAVSSEFFKATVEPCVDLSRVKFQNPIEKSEQPNFIIDNSRQFSRQKKKSSLFCQVLCSKPKSTADSGLQIPEHPQKLQDLLQFIGFWDFFKFDTPSPDDLIKQKQERAFKRKIK